MMSEPWFDGPTAGLVGGIGGSVLGLMGGIFGTLCGWLIPKGRGKTLLLGMMLAWMIIGASCLATGIYALSVSQPYHIWYTFALPGFLMALMGSIFFFALRNRYRETELRKMQAEELQ